MSPNPSWWFLAGWTRSWTINFWIGFIPDTDKNHITWTLIFHGLKTFRFHLHLWRRETLHPKISCLGWVTPMKWPSKCEKPQCRYWRSNSSCCVFCDRKTRWTNHQIFSLRGLMVGSRRRMPMKRRVGCFCLFQKLKILNFPPQKVQRTHFFYVWELCWCFIFMLDFMFFRLCFKHSPKSHKFLCFCWFGPRPGGGAKSGG